MPKPAPDASQSTRNWRVMSGICKTGADKRAYLRAAKASVASAVQTNASLHRRHVSGAAMELKSRMNFR
jgi:hypothetical protein